MQMPLKLDPTTGKMIMVDDSAAGSGSAVADAAAPAAPAAPASLPTEEVSLPPSQPAQPAPAQIQVSLDDLLGFMVAKDASDLHISVGSRIAFRTHSKMLFVTNVPELNAETFRSLLTGLMYGNKTRVDAFYEKRDADFSYSQPDGAAFRVNAFFKRGMPGVVIRKINRNAPALADLNLPAGVQKFINAKQGLVLITGPTGSGKSTSMTGIVDAINETREDHILTIEDPIEFIFQSKKSLISQREVGNDTDSFKTALRAAMREDPDIVIIGEMRDEETVTSAINLAETGHLVFSTLHTSGAQQTLGRLLSFYPPTEHTQVQSRLAHNLLGILSQRLLPRQDRPGRVGIFELMIVNGAIRNIIRTGDITQINNVIHTNRDAGMISMQSYAEELEKQGIIRREDYIGYFKEE